MEFPFKHIAGGCLSLQFMEREGFDEALESLDCLIADYAKLGAESPRDAEVNRDARFRPAF